MIQAGREDLQPRHSQDVMEHFVALDLEQLHVRSGRGRGVLACFTREAFISLTYEMYDSTTTNFKCQTRTSASRPVTLRRASPGISSTWWRNATAFILF
jgi:hypothetical protein